MKKKFNLPPLNLQRFADGEGENTSVFGFDTGVANPLLADDTVVANPLADDTTVVAEPIIDDNSNDDTVVVDDVVEPAPQEQQIDFTDIRNKLDTILNKVDKQEEEPTPQEPQEPEPPKLTDEEIEQLNNDFYLKFTEKPLEAMQDLINQRAEEIANEKIAPIQQHFQQEQQMNYWRGEIDKMEQAHPDFKEMANDISEIIKSDESIRNAKNPLELAYKVIKSDKLEAKMTKEARPLSEQIKDEGTLKELLKNPEIKNMIFNELKTDKAEIPQVIGGRGQTSVNVGDKPKNIRDATKAWLNS